MNDNKTNGVADYAAFLQQSSELLNLTLSDIRDKYADFPYCLIDYFEKDMTEKSIEIRFDKEEMTITCTFNPEGRCNCIILFADRNNLIEEIICYLKETYEYNFIKNRWVASGYSICVKETSYPPHDIYIMLFS